MSICRAIIIIPTTRTNAHESLGSIHVVAPALTQIWHVLLSRTFRRCAHKITASRRLGGARCRFLEPAERELSHYFRSERNPGSIKGAIKTLPRIFVSVSLFREKAPRNKLKKKTDVNGGARDNMSLYYCRSVFLLAYLETYLSFFLT